MSLEEAESHHDGVLAEYDEDSLAEFDDAEPELPAKFGMAEVDVPTSAPIG